VVLKVKSTLNMLQFQEENSSRTASVACSGDNGDLTLCLPRIYHHAGL